MSTDLDKINLGPQDLASAFLISPEQWLRLQVGMARLLYGKRLGLTDGDYEAGRSLAREWLQGAGSQSFLLVERLRDYGSLHTQKFAADRTIGDVSQLRSDISDLHGLASTTQSSAQDVFNALQRMGQEIAALKTQLLEHGMWAADLDTNLDVMQNVIQKMMGLWGALAADLNDLAEATKTLPLSAIMTKVKDGAALREWNTVVGEANSFLANAVQIPSDAHRFGQSFTDDEGNQHGAGLCGDMERGLQLGEATDWYLAKLADNSNYIFAADTWQCLTAVSDSNTGFLYPALENANGENNQRWRIVPADPGSAHFLIVSQANDQCLASEIDHDGAHLLTNSLVDRSRDGQSLDSGVANLKWMIWQAD